jgi:hypothetical protein
LREQDLEARERWPKLSNLLSCYFHEHFRALYVSVDGAVDRAVSEHSLEYRQAILKEWRDWNATRGWKEDVHRFMLHGFHVYYTFDTPAEARGFMNMIYEKLIASVRAETEGKWKP